VSNYDGLSPFSHNGWDAADQKWTSSSELDVWMHRLPLQSASYLIVM